MTPRRAALWTAAAIALACVWLMADQAWWLVAIFYAFAVGLLIGRKTTKDPI